jgi:hypothetical protein
MSCGKSFLSLFFAVVTASADIAVSAPRHLEIVCDETDETRPCTSNSRRAACMKWVGVAVAGASEPGSSLSLHVLRADGTVIASSVSACVPDVWPAPVRQQQQAYIKKICDAVAEPSSWRVRLPDDDCRGATTVGSDVVTLGFDIEAGSEATPGSERTPLRAALVCDVSRSTDELGCNAANVMRAYSVWLQESHRIPGSELRVYVPGTNFKTSTRVAEAKLEGSTSGEVWLQVRKARFDLSHLSRPATFGSAVAECIGLAAFELFDSSPVGTRKLLMSVGDMRQVSQSIPDFPPANLSTVVEILRRSGSLADLKDVAIRACGIHVHEVSGVDTGLTEPAARALRSAWEIAFKGMGATDVRVVSDCSDALAVKL